LARRGRSRRDLETGIDSHVRWGHPLNKSFGNEWEARHRPARPSPACCLARHGAGRLRVHEKGDDETVQTQDLGENENENHADKEARLLRCTPDTSIADNTDGKTSSETSETDGKTGTELDEAGKEGLLLAEVTGDEDRDNETIDSNDTSHNDGDDVLHDEVRTQDTHGRDTDTRLGRAV
jgi:hypothetical protein